MDNKFNATKWFVENESELEKETIGYEILIECSHCGKSFYYHAIGNQSVDINNEIIVCPGCNKLINDISDEPGMSAASKKINVFNVVKYINKLNNFVCLYRNVSLAFIIFFAILTIMTAIPLLFFMLVVELLLLCSIEKKYETLKQTLISLGTESEFEKFRVKSENAIYSNNNFKFDDTAIYDNSNAIFVANKIYMIYKSGKSLYVGLKTGKLVKFNSKLTPDQQDDLIMKFQSMNSQILVGKQYKSDLRKINKQ